MLLLQLSRKLTQHHSHGFVLRNFCTLQTLTHPSSSRNEPHFMVQYLIDTCGFSPDKATKASKDLRHLKSSSNPDSVLRFFRRRGLADADIAALVSRRPEILCASVEKTLTPKFQSLEQFGLSTPELVDLVTHNPNCLCYADVVPQLKFLKSVAGSNESLLKALKKDLFLLGTSLEKTLIPNVTILRQCGVPGPDIAKMTTLKRGFLTRSPAHVESIVAWAEELGAARNSHMFNNVLQTLICFNRETFGARRELWMSLGLSAQEFMAAFRRHPPLIHLSEFNARKKVEFLKEVGCELSYLTCRPGMFTYSLEKRLKPRSFVLRVLKRNGLPGGELDLYNAMTISEDKFLSRFVSPNEEKIPKLRAAYLAACAGNVSKLESIGVRKIFNRVF